MTEGFERAPTGENSQPELQGKAAPYAALVAARAVCSQTTCRAAGDRPLHNLGQSCGHISVWTQWQFNLDAEVMIVGQDWAGSEFLAANGPIVSPQAPSNHNLKLLIEGELGLTVTMPWEQDDKVLLTNAVLCVKPGGMAEPVRMTWARACVPRFTLPLIAIVRPKAVVALGRVAAEAIVTAARGQVGLPLDLASSEPHATYAGAAIFATYHPTGRNWYREKRAAMEATFRAVRLHLERERTAAMHEAA